MTALAPIVIPETGVSATGAPVISRADLTGVLNGLQAAVIGPFSVTAHGAVGDGVTDCTAFFQAAITAALAGNPTGAVITVPAGRYVLSAGLAINLVGTALTITGDGAGVSELVWISDTSGLGVTYTSAGWYTHGAFANAASGGGGSGSTLCIRGLSLISDNQRTDGHSSGTALVVQGDTISGRPGMPTVLENLLVCGASNTQQWATGIDLNNVGYISGRNIDIIFAYGTVGYGLAFSGTAGTQESVDHHITDLRVTYGNIGVVVGNGVQGVLLSQTVLVACQYGVQWLNLNVAPEDHLVIMGGHIAAGVTAIQTINVSDVVVSNMYFLAPAGAGAWIGVDAQNSAFLNVNNNMFRGTYTGFETGVKISRTTATPVQYTMQISGNQFANLVSYAIDFYPGFVGNVSIHGNMAQYIGGGFTNPATLPAGAVIGFNSIDGSNFGQNATLSGILEAQIVSSSGAMTAGGTFTATSGTIDGIAIGLAAQAKGAFTDLTVTGAVLINGALFRVQGMPAGDPHVAGLLWSDANGIVHISAG